jgi:uncharacterized membrane protein YdbT with pleckstrin-like domain
LGPAGSRFALWASAKTVIATIVVFVIARIAIPDLVNAHNTPLLLLAVLLAFAVLAIVAWTLLSIRSGYRRLKAAGSHLIETQK